MCTFNAEEVAALQSGGNERFFATYCATWTPASLPRPTDRHPERTREWIEAVYQAKRFYADIPADFAAPEGSPKAVASGAGASVASTASVNGDNEVAVLALEGLPRLQLSIPKPAAPATSAQSASSPAKAASQVASPTSKEPEPVSAPAAAAPVAEAPLVVPVAEPLPVAPAAEVWDPFAAPPEPPAPQPPIPEVKVAEATLPELQPAAAAATATTKAPAPAVPATNVTADDGASWAAFGDAFPQEPAVDAMSALASLNVPAPAPAPAPAANGSTERGAPGAVPVATPAANGNGGWHAFEAQAAASSGASTPSSVAPQNGAAVAAPVLPQAPVAAKPPSPPVNQRQEVPLVSLEDGIFFKLMGYKSACFCMHLHP